MITIAFFLLLCPGKYTNRKSDNTTFTLSNVHMFIGNRRLDLVNSSDVKLDQSQSASLTFTTQKNGVNNEVVHMVLSCHHYICVVKAINCRMYLSPVTVTR